jgi:hypothetical protein
MKEKAKELWDENKHIFRRISAIDERLVPFPFSMYQDEETSKIGFILDGAAAGGVVGLGASLGASAIGNAEFHPVLYAGTGAAAGALANNFRYRSDKDGKKKNKAKNLISNSKK